MNSRQFGRQRSDSNTSGLNTSKVSYNSMGSSFSDRLFRMKPIEKKFKIKKNGGEENEGKSNQDSSLLTEESDDTHRPLTAADLVSLFILFLIT